MDILNHPPTVLRKSKILPADIEAAGKIFLRVTCAYRDAQRLLLAGFAMALEPLSVILDADIDDCDLATVIERVIVKEACDLIDLYDRSPDEYPAGRSDTEALAATRKAIVARYRRGKCSLCKGSALLCARRHAKGRSCA